MTNISEPAWFPLALRLDDVRVLVVGGGMIAANKVRLLLAHRARVQVIAARLDDEMREWEKNGAIIHIATSADDRTLRDAMPGCRLVYAATDDRAINRAAAAIAREMNIPVCAVDDPAPSSFITPAQIHRGLVRIAISTGGGAPVLARRLREQVESVIPEGTGELALFMQDQREHVGRACPDIVRRRRYGKPFWTGRARRRPGRAKVPARAPYWTTSLPEPPRVARYGWWAQARATRTC